MSDSVAFPSLIDDCWVITGPTASGKSALAVQLAGAVNGEIVSMDSMAVYRSMDVGTAKPSASQRRQVPHHVIDIVDPDQPFSVACFLRAAHAAVQEIRQRGRTPLIVGGTPMYLRAILRGFDPGPPADWEFRKQVEADVQRFGLERLRERLSQVDPLSAHRLHPNDVRRMTRALEVAHLTGVPLSHKQLQFEQQRRPQDCKVVGCAWPRPLLHQRIDQRVAEMFAGGLVAETQQLLARYGTLSHTAARAVGYAEVIEHLDGRATLAETVASVQMHTRQLARRQETFLRSFGELRPLAMLSGESPEETCERLLEMA